MDYIKAFTIMITRYKYKNTVKTQNLLQNHDYYDPLQNHLSSYVIVNNWPSYNWKSTI